MGGLYSLFILVLNHLDVIEWVRIENPRRDRFPPPTMINTTPYNFPQPSAIM